MIDIRMEVTHYDGHRGSVRPTSLVFDGSGVDVLGIVRTWVEEDLKTRTQKRFFILNGSDRFTYTIYHVEDTGEWYLSRRTACAADASDAEKSPANGTRRIEVTITQPSPKDIILSGKRVRVWTGGTGPALLLLHSSWGDAEMSWASVWNELGAFFSVVAPDLPGFGASDPLEEPTLAANAGFLRDLLDARKIDRAVVAGNSFGVAVAIEFASLFPERTLSLVAVNGGYLPAVPGVIKKLMSLSFMEKAFRAVMRSMAYSDAAVAKAFPNPAGLPQGFIEKIRRNVESQARIVFDAFNSQAQPQKRPPVPASMIWGTGDRLVSAKQAGAIRTWLGNPDFIPIEGAGHLPQVEQPRAFVEAMKKIPGTSPGIKE